MGDSGFSDHNKKMPKRYFLFTTFLLQKMSFKAGPLVSDAACAEFYEFCINISTYGLHCLFAYLSFSYADFMLIFPFQDDTRTDLQRVEAIYGNESEAI